MQRRNSSEKPAGCSLSGVFKNEKSFVFGDLEQNAWNKILEIPLSTIKTRLHSWTHKDIFVFIKVPMKVI